jgi:hypothetical protein
VISPSLVSGNTYNPGNNTDPSYPANAGRGGVSGFSANPGAIVISTP